MSKRKAIRAIVLWSSVLVAIAAVAFKFFALFDLFSSADRIVSGLCLMVALLVGLFRSTYSRDTSQLASLAVAAIFVGFGAFMLIFAAAGSTFGAVLALFFAMAALFRILQPTEMWTHPIAIAMIITMLFWIAIGADVLSYPRGWISQSSSWIASNLLDTFTVAHLRDGWLLKTINGDIDVALRTTTWFGVVPIAAMLCVPIIAGRFSFAQAMLMIVSGLLTWACLQGISAGWSAWTLAEAASDAPVQGGFGYTMWNLLTVLVCFAVPLCIARITDPIPLERSDWDYPVATYFWNFFSRFPASLSSEVVA
jgi:hypothetical protein